MALYRIIRTDRPGPGEFVSGHVIAGGVTQARAAVSHLEGVEKDNLRAERVDLTKNIRLIEAYFDEREPETKPEHDPFTLNADYYTY